MVLVFSVCLMHPICLTVSFMGSFLYAVYLKRGKQIKTFLTWVLPVMVFTALLNPIFTHHGITILCYLPSGNPLTLESILYGIAAAGMIASALQWFSCYNEVMTSDKFVCLFGRVIPALSLVISMALRFVPRFSDQYKKVKEARMMLHPETAKGGIIAKVKGSVDILSAMITWSLENAIETGDSMRGRGYGLPKRTAYSIYRFDDRDKTALVVLLSLGLFIVAGWIMGFPSFYYYPMVIGAELSPFGIVFMVAYGILSLFPLFVDLWEDWTFARLKKAI